MVEFLRRFLFDGRIDPGIGEQPGMPNNRVTRLQPIICCARPLPCLALYAVPTTAPGKRAPANPFAEMGLGLVARLGMRPSIDQIPNPNLVFDGQAMKQLDKRAELPLVRIRPSEDEG